ncbi:Retrovirus-related Pol polyprotein from transposon opus [Gossypium australe]|uniref:Retrovirus-related Pol polyprotein from transposon opus n=1 Tax=Gossypium australe TaxID=47621 RepID=A0A5B6VAL1_9ROSI|nr:Retrovirus-related Pol polyprotein from transposon opus [Gossypium australe]
MSRHKKLKKGQQIKIVASCRSFTIPVEIGNKHFSKTIRDLGANINLMLLFIYLKLKLGELKNMTITLQLVDRSFVHPKGVLEDVLVKFRGLIIPFDFVVLDFEEDQDISILLGRPFFAMSKLTIGFENNDLIMKINGTKGSRERDKWKDPGRKVNCWTNQNYHQRSKMVMYGTQGLSVESGSHT